MTAAFTCDFLLRKPAFSVFRAVKKEDFRIILLRILIFKLFSK